ncbi:MAG: tetratricopeptide repeat protein [Anaerolineales bacterium]|nr:tetratricopeptide repeat protein [Anaerolineales bacterium]
MLRYLRERAHLSQRELAALVGYHYSYVSYVEKNTRIPDEASLLGRFIPALELQDEPELIARLLELAKETQKKSPPKREAESNIRSENTRQLPVILTSMLGRENESAALIKLLRRAEVRIVTIVGPPGVGKTRLALHVAEQAEVFFADGVAFVDLTPVTQPELTLSAIAAALGIQKLSAENLKAALRKKNMLILLDNFEQVVEAAPQIVALPGNAPNIKILVTSREALRVRGEQEFPLAPLPVPTNSILDSPAVQLFIERARAVKPTFQLDEKTAPQAAEICRRLDGLPLAIELAAARVQTMTLSAMLEQFSRRFEWLTRGARDLPVWRQTLSGAIEWSYALLSGQERALLDRLSIFAGGWTLEAAEAICADEILCAPSDILSLLMQLADKSLISAEGERYHFLETLREFAYEKLTESGELERVRKLHYDYYLQFAQTARPNLLQGGNQAYWLTLMDQEHNNMRAALVWSTETPTRAAAAINLGWAMHVFWYGRGHISEARRWLDQILALDPAPTAIRADLLRYASDYASAQGDLDAARALEEEGMEISKTLEDEAGVYYSMDGLAMLAGMQGDYARAAELLEQVLAYRRVSKKDTLLITTTLNNLAIATRRLGDLERAKQLYTESIETAKNVGNVKSLSHALTGLAEVHVDLKEYAAALQLQRESISIRYKLGDLKGAAFSLEAIAMTMNFLGDSLIAAKLESASSKIRRELGMMIAPATRAENENFLAQLRAKLGDATFEEAWASGQALSLEQAAALVEGIS